MNTSYQYEPISTKDQKLHFYLPTSYKGRSYKFEMLVNVSGDLDYIPLPYYMKELQLPQQSQQQEEKRLCLLSVPIEELENKLNRQNNIPVIPISKSHHGQLLTHRYEPKRFSELLSDERINREVLGWLKRWGIRQSTITTTTNFLFQKINTMNHNIKPQQVNQDSQIILLSGPPGTGKTTLARVVAKMCGYQPIEINASDERSADSLIQRIESMCQNKSLSEGKYQKTLVILDEVDGALESESGGAINRVLQYIFKGNKKKGNKKGKTSKKIIQNQPETNNNNSGKSENEDEELVLNETNKQNINIKRPVIFICNDPYSKGLRELRKMAQIYYFKKQDNPQLIQRLKEICHNENIKIDLQTLQKLCMQNDYDIRSCLGALQMYSATGSLLQSQQNLTKSVLQHLEDFFFNQGGVLKNSTELINTLIKQVEPQLLMDATFENYLQISTCTRKFYYVPHFLDQLCLSDIINFKKFLYNYELQRFIPLIAVFFMNKLSQPKKIQLAYPIQNIEIRRKIKQNLDIIDALTSHLKDTGLKNKKNFSSNVVSYIYKLIQPRSQLSIMSQEERNELMMSLNIVDGFKIQILKEPLSFMVNSKQQQEINFNPQLERLIAFSDITPNKSMNIKTRTLMINLLPMVRKKVVAPRKQQVKIDYLEKYDQMNKKRNKPYEISGEVPLIQQAPTKRVKINQFFKPVIK